MQNRRITVHFPPTRPGLPAGKVSIILFGTIDASPGNWTSQLTEYLSDLPCVILNPRRDDWDSTWREDINFQPFKEQVDWEMDYAMKAKYIVFYFKPGTPTPVTLLELGMYAGKYPERCLVCCPQGFYKKGNVEIVCQRFGVPFFEHLDQLKEELKARAGQDSQG